MHVWRIGRPKPQISKNVGTKITYFSYFSITTFAVDPIRIRYSLGGNSSVIFMSASLLNRGQHLWERIFSPKSEFFPLSVNPSFGKSSTSRRITRVVPLCWGFSNEIHNICLHGKITKNVIFPTCLSKALNVILDLSPFINIK